MTNLNTFCGLTQSESVELRVLNDKFLQGAFAFEVTPEIEQSKEYKRLNELVNKKMTWFKSRLN
jgi:hypothetical protein